MWQFWVDRGGTFTDIVACDPNGALSSHKFLSENPEQYKDAAVFGIRKILNLTDEQDIPENTIEAVKMGTTVATNALLERAGERTLLLITKGFGDLLRIGYQNRPKLFDLNIKLPEMLYECVSEVSERISPEGTVLEEIDAARTESALLSAYQQGIRSVAIVFMHGYKYQQHEKIAAKLAKDVGFTQISVSHEVSPLIKFIARGDTTVVDAYLSPILRRYVNQVSDNLKTCPALMFMQSNGGLTAAHLFQGKDSILSGPAGGVVGMVKSAEISGYHKLIGFDMGGTSTDVCHYNNEFERSFDTEVAGVRMRAPMMKIHTVAAGGGSILSFKDGRFQVGPESAGANPGPVAYRRGGPLTVTDCNVLLGKIQPEYFPKVFGPNANEPLSVSAVREAFILLAQEIAQETNEPIKSPEELAEGFLRIAVENMSNAIKKISVQRGYDVSEYTMNCFGGAGGQHACQVADNLGMTRILIHPFAGVLSAFGMGLADIRAIREQQFSKNISEYDAAIKVFESLDKETHQEVLSQGINERSISILHSAHIRIDGSHQTIPIEFGTPEEMRASFEAAHMSCYGFVPDYESLIIDVLVSEAVGLTQTNAKISQSIASASPNQMATVCLGGETMDIPLIYRESMRRGEIINGPVIIVESTGTNLVEKGWRCFIDENSNLILERYLARESREAIGTNVDPVMLEIFNNLFMSIAEQMGVTLENTAYSVNIKERLDFSCALFDEAGCLIANAPHVPVHLGSMSESVQSILKANEGNIRPGDVFMMNNPFNGGTHLPDVTVITPIFDESKEKIVFTLASRGHHADIGGKTPGSAPPDSTHIEQEGVVIDNFKLVEQGKFREQETRKLLASGQYPCRNIDQNIADLSAQIAANATGAQELNKIVQKFGLKTVHAYMKHVQNNAEESVRRVLEVLDDCHYDYYLDSGAKISVNILVNKMNRSATIDFTGTSTQDSLNYNAPLSICRAVVLYVLRTLVGNEIPMNEGCMKPISLIIPKGSMINPQYPAAVISGNTEVSQAIADTLYGALGVVAGSQGTMNNFVYGNDQYQNYETICGGAGAGNGFNGASAVHTHMTNTRMTDPEILESRFPVLLEEFSIRENSGGKGKYSGGEGIIRKLKFLTPMKVTVLSSHRKTRAFGLNGGEDGHVGINQVLRANGELVPLEGNDACDMNVGDVFEMRTPGGGAFGAKS